MVTFGRKYQRRERILSGGDADVDKREPDAADENPRIRFVMHDSICAYDAALTK